MARTFYLITACGWQDEHAHETVASSAALARAHPEMAIVHYVIFNNGVVPVDFDVEPATNHDLVITDIGRVGSRALARNSALDDLARGEREPGVVCFLDAGDVLLDAGAIEMVLAGLEHWNTSALWAFAAQIVGADIRSTRGPRPLRLRKINNPFLIGATFATTDLAIRARFREGAKEDWKYWLDLLDLSPRVELRPEVAYEYRVVSTVDHVNRKRRLFRDQYRFFTDYLGYGHGPKAVGSLVVHILIAGTSWLRRSSRWRPWTWFQR